MRAATEKLIERMLGVGIKKNRTSQLAPRTNRTMLFALIQPSGKNFWQSDFANFIRGSINIVFYTANLRDFRRAIIKRKTGFVIFIAWMPLD